MAFIQETLGNAKPPTPKYSVRQNFYQPPSPPHNLDLGANIHFGERFSNPGVYNALANQSPSRQAPAADYSSQYNFDPILAKINAMGDQNVDEATAGATNLSRQAFIDTGAADVASDYGADSNTIQAALANPNSALAMLRKDKEARLKGLDEALNDQNLFYSGERQRQLGEQEAGYAGAQGDLLRRLRELLGNINAGVLGAKLRAYKPPAPTPPPFVPGSVGPPGRGGVTDIAPAPPSWVPQSVADNPQTGWVPQAAEDYTGDYVPPAATEFTGDYVPPAATQPLVPPTYIPPAATAPQPVWNPPPYANTPPTWGVSPLAGALASQQLGRGRVVG